MSQQTANPKLWKHDILKLPVCCVLLIIFENWDHLWLTVAYLKLSLSLSYMQLPTAY